MENNIFYWIGFVRDYTIMITIVISIAENTEKFPCLRYVTYPSIVLSMLLIIFPSVNLDNSIVTDTVSKLIHIFFLCIVSPMMLFSIVHLSENFVIQFSLYTLSVYFSLTCHLLNSVGLIVPIIAVPAMAYTTYLDKKTENSKMYEMKEDNSVFDFTDNEEEDDDDDEKEEQKKFENSDYESKQTIDTQEQEVSQSTETLININPN